MSETLTSEAVERMAVSLDYRMLVTAPEFAAVAAALRTLVAAQERLRAVETAAAHIEERARDRYAQSREEPDEEQAAHKVGVSFGLSYAAQALRAALASQPTASARLYGAEREGDAGGMGEGGEP